MRTELTTVPMRSENHPTWNPKWRLATNQALFAIDTGDEPTNGAGADRHQKLAKTL
jgi:hypothetical protein